MPTKPPPRRKEAPAESQKTPSLYEPLPEGHFVRVLILEPGHGDQMMFGRLEVVDLDQAPDFEAISYVWGAKRKRRTMFCNNVVTRLTQNLSEALRRVRHPSEPRAVWADAICINQDHNAEKSHQVSLMGRIYARARRVLIHVAGPEEGHASCVASLVADVDSMVRLTMSDIGRGFDHFPWPDPILKTRAMEDIRWASFTVLSRKPWFKRGWVIQEAGLAQKATILWGDHTEIDWQAFMRCFAWLCFRSMDVAQKYDVEFLVCHEIPYFHRNPYEVLAYGRASAGRDGLLTILDRARFFRFGNPKDRIFAFLDLDRYVRRRYDRSEGHAEMADPLIFEPDYSRSTEEVYTHFATQYLQKRGVEILQCVQHNYYTLSDFSLPSWVPRWDQLMGQKTLGWGPPQPLRPDPPPRPVEAIHTYLGHVVGERTIEVRGVVFDTVTGTQMRFTSDQPLGNPPVDVFAAWRAVASSMRGREPNFYALASRFLYTLTLGQTSGDWADWWRAIDKYCTFLQAWAEKMDGHQGDVVEERLPPSMQRSINLDCWNQSLFFTSRGYLGNGPHMARAGDVLCIVFGCSCPFLLRRLRVPGRPVYRLVGQAWLPGTQQARGPGGVGHFYPVVGSDESKDWVEWGLREQNIQIC